MNNNYKGNNIVYSKTKWQLMKTLPFILSLILINLNGFDVNAKDWDWARQGNSSVTYARSLGTSVATDANGNVYSVGDFFNTPTINFGSTTLTNLGGRDIFIVKYDSLGNVLWAKSMGGSGNDMQPAIATDASGNIFITGSTGSPNFPTLNPGGGNYFQATMSGSSDAFIAKYNNSGTLLWSTYYGGSSSDEGNGIAIDIVGDVIITGSTSSTNFPTISGFQMTNGGGAEDAFIAKFNNTGVRLWATYFGGNGFDIGYDVATDLSGNVIITGSTSSTNTLASAGSFQAAFAGGFNDAFVAKFTSNGIRQWSTYYGGTNSEESTSIAVDGSGNLCITGYTYSTNFPVSSGAFQTIYGGSIDAFYVKFSASGMRLWATYYGGLNQEMAYGIATDTKNNIYLVGTSFPGARPITAKVDSNGIFLWQKSPELLKMGNNEQAKGIAIDTKNNVYITGSVSKSRFSNDTLKPIGDTIFVFTARLSGTSDLVWPGDANRDLVANNNDLLAIGIGYGSTGASRTNASIVWKGQETSDWGTMLSNGNDYKNVDCNGNGIINSADTTAIIQNYGLTHNLKTAIPDYQSGLPDLQVQFPMDTIYPGQTLSLPVNLGDNGNPIAAIYGLAYTINFNSKDIDTSKIKMRYSTSWLANGGGNLLSIQKVWGKQGQLDIAVTRTNHTNISGYGQIGTLDIVMKDDIVPKLASTFTKKFQLDITSVKAIKVDETPVFLNALKDSVIIKVYQVMTGINNSIGADEFVVYPNPATEKLIIRSAGIISKVELINSLGQQILVTGVAADNFVTLETGAVLPGIYYLAVSTNKGRFVQRVCIER